MKMLMTLMVVACVMVSPAMASTTFSSSVLTVDNEFALYLSTNDSIAGTLIGTGVPSSWSTPFSFNASLAPGVNYLHVYAQNYTEPNYPYPTNDPQSNPAAFLGEFSLIGGGYQFDNSGTTLLTDTTNWKVSTIGWGVWDGTVASQGPNGVAPWGTVSGISSSAEWIWTPDKWETPRYFSARISPTTPNVPEASTLMLGMFGLSGMAGALRLRKK